MAEYGYLVGEEEEIRLGIQASFLNEYTRNFINSLCIDKKNINAADFGSGLGHTTELIADIVGENGTVTGIDNSRESLGIAKKRLKNIHFEEASVYDLSNYKNKFDLVFCRYLFLHLHNPDLGMQSIVSTLKDDGIIVCEDVMDINFFLCPPKMETAMARFIEYTTNFFNIKKIDACIGRQIPSLLKKNGIGEIKINIVRPILDTENKKSLLRKHVEMFSKVLSDTTTETLNLIKDLEKIEKDKSIYCVYHTFGQFAGRRII